MPLGASVIIRNLSMAEVAVAHRLAVNEGWNQTERDWQRLTELLPEGCLAAFQSEQLLGTISAITYGDLAWIGMMLVAPEQRGKGIGKMLLRHAIRHCELNRVRRIGLDATPSGRPLYESFGFVSFGEVERWQGFGLAADVLDSRPSLRQVELQAICHFDELAFQPSRHALLLLLLDDCAIAPSLSRVQDGTLRGYALARPGARASYIGPVVALEPHTAAILIDDILERLAGQAFIDVPVGRPVVAERLVARGFTVQRTLTRMSLNEQPMQTSDLIFAIAGPELG